MFITCLIGTYLEGWKKDLIAIVHTQICHEGTVIKHYCKCNIMANFALVLPAHEPPMYMAI